MQAKISMQTFGSHQAHELHKVKLLMPALCRVRQGRKVIEWQGRTETADPTQLIVFPAGYEFHIENIPVSGRYLAEFISIPLSAIKMSHKYSPSVTEKSEATRFCSNLTKELEYCWEQLKVALGMELAPQLVEHIASGLILMLRHTGYGNVLLNIPGTSLASRCQDLIILSPAFHWTATDMAGHLHMSVSTFYRHLAAEGETFQTILNDVRLGNALNALQTTDKSVSEIARDNGYQCPSRFTASFKRRYQITPRELRKAIL
ncbi:AraC family transcriptional regulator [Salmonella enterica subsp. enterica serovar Java]|uniref:AraC family transcriptional regulator n=1 Tax=Salmonella enterica subsp. enterica serovar Java TaxID=224729 RepID=A0A4U8FEH4_SALEB|nr:helix-turn-helix transcriptional regulator [Salmonella enterica]EAC1115730.1 AraC family transcriptional regulator [Salmonella enterica subsp. enterica serovar Java]EBW2275216.1 AraC family transcriptional regulator [Salmonella enterica subsp. enterica serovar Java]EBX9966361.1 AraC family transcriptional regulator [Salmonella enterica subsp. enterica serovar Java]EBY2882277.1 AraC family transcriptional regulator [Salmonella enterica subsp. enterica serovar Java]EBZ5277613.1 AraC family tr